MPQKKQTQNKSEAKEQKREQMRETSKATEQKQTQKPQQSAEQKQAEEARQSKEQKQNQEAQPSRQPTEPDKEQVFKELEQLRKENQTLKQSIEQLKAAFETLKNEYQKAQAEKNQLLDIARRLKADFDNYKKRVEKERKDLLVRIKSEIFAEILPLIDNLERVIESPGENVQSFKEGVSLILKQFFEVLSKNNVKEVGKVGEKFDPRYHEAFMREFRNDVEEGTITEVFMKGYMINGILIRPARVKVAVRVPEPEAESHNGKE